MCVRDNFDELHQRLLRCYQSDILAMQEEVTRLTELNSPEAVPSSSPKSSPQGRLPVMQPKSFTDPKTVPLPEEEVQILELNAQGGLWQSEAFQEDLQACKIQKRDMQLFLSQMSDQPKPQASVQSSGPKGSKGDGRKWDRTASKSSDSTEGEEKEEEKWFHPRAFWANAADDLEADLRNHVKATRRSSVYSAQTVQDDKIVKLTGLKNCFHGIQHPGSRFHAWWDSFGMMLLAYDLVVIPLQVFEIGESVALKFLFWVAHVYWQLAILVSFVTGYEDAGIVIFSLKKTIKRYAFSWFLFDAALVTLDWYLLAIEDGSAGVARLSRTARSLRFLRFFRLGRLAKLASTIKALKDQLASRVANLQYSIFKILLQLILSNHLIACFWFLLGDDGSMGDTTEEVPNASWVDVLQLKDRSVAYQYFTSLHWAYAQLGVGQTEIEAVNLQERIFSVIISFLALINFSTMVSSMTSLLASLQKLKNDEVEQFGLLRSYLSYNNIDKDLSHRVTRFLQHAFDLKNRAISKDVQVPLLDMLSKPLQEELQLQRHLESFSDNEFLNKLLVHSDYQIYRVVCDIATSCLKHMVLALDDLVFASGSVATACYYIADGECRYANPSAPQSFKLCNTWMAEMCLWSPWIHLGDLVAQDISRLVIIEVTKFAECIAKDFGARHMACQYASEVVGRLNQKKIFSDLPPKAMLAMAAGASHNNLPPQGEVRGWLASWGCCSLKRPSKRPSFNKVVPNQDG